MNFVGFWVCLGTRGMVVMAFVMWGEREGERERERSFETKKGYTQPTFFKRDFRLRVGMMGCQRGRYWC